MYPPFNLLSWMYLCLPPEESIKNIFITRVNPFRMLPKLMLLKLFFSMFSACLDEMTHCNTPRQAVCQHPTESP